MTWLTEWNRRKSKIVNGTVAGSQTNYQMKLTVHKGPSASSADIDLGTYGRDDFGDTRFTSSDGSTLLNYYIESITGTAPDFIATIWVRIDSIPTSPGTSIFYIYYDNPTATITTNNLDATFLASDMTALTKIDPNNKITINSSSNTTFTNLRRDDIAYLYKSIPSTLDYRLDIEYVVTGGSSSPNNDGQVNFAGVSDTLNILNNTIDSLFIRNYNAFHVSIYRLYMMDIISGISNIVPPGDNYAVTNSGYITITRIGTTVTMNVYTNAARTIHAAGSPRIGTVSPIVGMTYAIPLSSDYRAGLTANVSGYIQNLTIRKYASPEPTFGATGTQEMSGCTAPVCNFQVT